MTRITPKLDDEARGKAVDARAFTPQRAQGTMFRPSSHLSEQRQPVPASVEWLARPKGPEWRRNHLTKWQEKRGYAKDIVTCNAYLPLKLGRRAPGFTDDGRAASWARVNAVETGTSMFKPGTAGNPRM